ncbi:MAG: hypothetical protein K0S61_571 [Anaerocolumna sp.]|nr:hypothetical protein [Anaerocolumna sp.]
MRNKLIIYVAAISEDDKGGWSFAYFRNKEFQEMHIGYGKSSYANSSKQIEIAACIVALDNIMVDKDVETIEMRIGYTSIVKEMNQISSYYYLNAEQIANSAKRLRIHDETLLLRFAQFIIQSKYMIRLKKVDLKDDYYNLVCKHARNAIYENSLTEDNYCLKNATTREIYLIPRQSSESKSSPNEGSEQKQNSMPWYQKDIHNTQVVELNVDNIVLKDEIHLKTKKLDLAGILYIASNTKQIRAPIVVRRVDEDTFALVIGLKSYCVAKILGIKKINAHITDLNRDAFVKSNSYKSGY